MSGPNQKFWQDNFEIGRTPWERAGVHPQLLAWLDSAELKPCRIAVPGCGSGWEVAELARRGFEVVAIDYTQAAIDRCTERLAREALSAELHLADVLEFVPGLALDAVYEQTCLCALYPDHWVRYAVQLQRWLHPGGQLYAQFMQVVRPAAVDQGRIEGPPYHCDINGMRALFPAPAWDWPHPPYAKQAHPMGSHEFAVVLRRV